jgi:hypothetical protein
MKTIKLKPSEEIITMLLRDKYNNEQHDVRLFLKIYSFKDWLIYYGYADNIQLDKHSSEQVYQKDLDQALKSAMSAIRPQDECCRQCGQYNGHAIHCVFNIAEF